MGVIELQKMLFDLTSLIPAVDLPVLDHPFGKEEISQKWHLTMPLDQMGLMDRRCRSAGTILRRIFIGYVRLFRMVKLIYSVAMDPLLHSYQNRITPKQ